jgi:hypothetical protein
MDKLKEEEVCPNCLGEKYTVEVFADCCGWPDENGFCCGIPKAIQEQVECDVCNGTGIVIKTQQ